jgi:ketosteroid isomerase-like protein
MRPATLGISEGSELKTAAEAIADNYTAFAEAFHKGDADAISQMYTADGQLLVPQAPVINGPPAIAGVWRGIVGTGGSSVRVTTAEVQECGDWAYEVGAFATTGPDGSPSGGGKYIVIWKRQDAGTWKIHRDIFTPD